MMDKKSNKNFKCSNSKCITNHEHYVKTKFTLIDEENKIYLCDYCSSINKLNQEV